MHVVIAGGPREAATTDLAAGILDHEIEQQQILLHLANFQRNGTLAAWHQRLQGERVLHPGSAGEVGGQAFRRLGEQIAEAKPPP